MPPFHSMGQLLRWIFSSLVIYFSWKLTAVLGVLFFDRTMAFPTESKWAFFRRNAPCQKAMYLMRYSLSIHAMYLLLAFAFHADYSTMHSPTSPEKNQERLLQMLGVSLLTSLGVLPLISAELWFEMGLGCHWTHDLIRWLVINWLWVSAVPISFQSCSKS